MPRKPKNTRKNNNTGKKNNPADWQKLNQENPHQDIDDALSVLDASEAVEKSLKVNAEVAKAQQATENLERHLTTRIQALNSAQDKAVEIEQSIKKHNAKHKKLFSPNLAKLVGAERTPPPLPNRKNSLPDFGISGLNPPPGFEIEKRKLQPGPVITQEMLDPEKPIEVQDEDIIRDPTLMERFVKKMEDAAKWKHEIDEYNDSGFIAKLKSFNNLSFSQKSFVALEVIKNAFTSALSGFSDLVSPVWSQIQKVFTYTFRFINEKLLPTQSSLNKAFGASTFGLKQLNAEAMKTGDQFWDLGLGFEQGTKDVNDLGVAMNSARIPRDALSSLIKVAEYVGVGAEEAGKLANSFLASGTRVQDLGGKLDEVFKSGASIALQFGVPINSVNKELAASPDLLQRFGTENYRQFQKSIAVARRYNLSIRDVEKTFGKTMDTFSNTAETSAKLNARFGTSIDSLKVLNMQTSDERWMYFREELAKTGVVWDKLDKFQKNVITSTFGIDEAQGALYFGSQKTRKEQQALIKTQEANKVAAEDWKKAIASLRSQLVDWNRELSIVYRAIGNVIGRFFGFKNGTDATIKGVSTLKNIAETAAKAINKFAETIPEGNDGFGQMATWIDKIDRLVQNANSSLTKMSDLIDFITSPKDYLLATRWIEDYDKALQKGDMRFAEIQDRSVATTDANFQRLYKSRYANMHGGEEYMPLQEKQKRKAQVVAQSDAMLNIGRTNTLPLSLQRRGEIQEIKIEGLAITVNGRFDGKNISAQQVVSSTGQARVQRTN